MPRTQAILGRLPAHLEAARPGKRLGEVTAALAADLDNLSAALARVRRARRLLDADELRDLLRIAAVHGITPAELAILFSRLARTRAVLADPETTAETAEQVFALWGIAEPAPRLARYGTWAAAVPFVRRAVAPDVLLDAVRQRVAVIAATHAHGNGTVRALIAGAANALDLDVRAVAHSRDRYLHTADVEDRLALRYPVATPTAPAARFTPAAERLLVEENPLVPATTGGVGRTHAELFSVLRRGFERETLQVLVTGVEDRTLGPMLVNRDEGHGVGFTGAVPSGLTVSFSEEGRVLLDGADVTSQAFAWQGACFGEAAARRPADFVFDAEATPLGTDRAARFAAALPTGALAADFVFPHAGNSLPMPGVAVGETRFAFFIQEGHYARLDAGPLARIERVEPRPAVALADQSVFAAGPSETRPTAGVVELAWHERAAFRVTVWIPQRFRALTPDDAEGRDTLERVAFAVNRFRPAGVQVDVKYLDDRWVLGRGMVLTGESSDEPVGPGLGTELWSAPPD